MFFFETRCTVTDFELAVYRSQGNHLSSHNSTVNLTILPTI